jgi:isopenicillin N synthase-like dioxygenase
MGPSVEREVESWDFNPRSFREMAWYGESDAPDGVPVLDLAAMLDVRNGSRRRQLAALRDAVTSSGFLYLKNHGIAEDALAAISCETRTFYGQPEAYKRSFDHRDQIRGYTGYRVESTARLFGTSHGKDLCMKYTMGPELSPEEIRARITSDEDLASNAYSPNVFPTPSFRAAWVTYDNAVHRASMQLLELVGDALELDAKSRELWRKMLVERSCGELRYFQYPDVPRAACTDVAVDGFADRMAAHFDMDVITLLHQTLPFATAVSGERRSTASERP